MATQALYRSYLLRLWRESEQTPWRATLESPGAGEQIAFARLADLFAFLEEQTDERVFLPAHSIIQPSHGTRGWMIR